jgi:hypothetical protein
VALRFDPRFGGEPVSTYYDYDTPPWEPDYVPQSIHEIDSKRDEPMMQHPSFPVMPDTQAARAWKERLMRTIK